MAGELEQVLMMLAAGGGGRGGGGGIKPPSYQAYLPSQATSSLNAQMGTNPYAMGHWYAAQSRDKLRQLEYSEDLARSNTLAAALAKQKMMSEADTERMKAIFANAHQYPGTTWGTAVGSYEGGLTMGNPLVQQSHVLGTALHQARGMKDLGDANKNGITPGEPTSKALGAIKVGPIQQNKGDGSSSGPKYTVTHAFPRNGILSTYRGVGNDPNEVEAGVRAQVDAAMARTPSRTGDNSGYSPAARAAVDRIKQEANRSGDRIQVVDGPDGQGGAILTVHQDGQSYEVFIDKNGKSPPRQE